MLYYEIVIYNNIYLIHDRYTVHDTTTVCVPEYIITAVSSNLPYNSMIENQ